VNPKKYKSISEEGVLESRAGGRSGKRPYFNLQNWRFYMQSPQKQTCPHWDDHDFAPQPTQQEGKPPQSANLAKCGKCEKEWDDAAQSSVCPHPLKSEDIEKWVNLANQNALEREAWADRYDKLHIALCQACECLNQGDPATAHRIIRVALTGGDK
jgi:hypothetical protein